MCGIVAYNGLKQASPIIIEGLKRLEYRGYDSAGIAVMGEKMQSFKQKGKVIDLEMVMSEHDISGTIGLGHTRWATHGAPNDINAHPQRSGNHDISLVHNGIIENYDVLKKLLTELGHQFESDTDTEVLVHMIEEYQGRENCTIEEAVNLALQKVIGAYAIVVFDKKFPDRLVGARKSSPLLLGIGEDELFLASDAAPVIKYTNKVIYLEDGEIVVLKKNGEYQISNLKNELLNPQVQELELSLEAIEKEGYEHFMLKEIFQQKDTVYETLRGRFSAFDGWVSVGGLKKEFKKILKAKRLIMISSGTSWHAALVGEYLIEELARIPVEVEYSSEFRYRNPIISKRDVVVAISQSGETADTLAALELANSRHATTYGIVNVVGSSIARATKTGSYTHAGPEIGVASTKAFTSQVAMLTLVALSLAQERGTLSRSFTMQILTELENIPKKIERVLANADKIKYVASEIKDATNALYLGRGYNFPIALEGALKLKEISYIHAEGYPAAEMKHGPIALIDDNMPVVFIATRDSVYDKIISNIEEVRARRGRVIAIATEGDKEIAKKAEHVIYVPETLEVFTPLITIIPLQLLAYHMAVLRKCDVDQPRNLAKSVTVE